MSEILTPKKAINAIVALGLSTAALTACASTESTEPMVVGVTCPEDTAVNIEKTENPTTNYGSTANIFVSCDGEQPSSMQLLNDGHTEVIDNTEGQSRIEIEADYYGGDSFLNSGEDPFLSLNVSPEEDQAQIIVNDIDRVTRVEVVE